MTRARAARAELLGGLALLAAAIAVYLPALHGALLWDDDAHLTRSVLRDGAGLWRIWTDLGATQQYYPVLHSAFWIEQRLWGDAVLGYHLANALQHGIAALLLVLLVQRLAIPGAWLAGFLFALHPIAVESVAWISEQKNTLSTIWYLAAALAFLRYADTRRTRDYALATGLFLLALGTKSVTATLPAALLVVLWWRHGRLAYRHDVRPLLLWFVVAIASGALTAWFEHRLIGANGAEFALTWTQRLLLSGRVIVHYATTLLWPTALTFTYPRWEIIPSWTALLYPVGVALTLIVGWLLRALSRAPLAVLLLFCGTLVPVLGFVNVYPFRYAWVADHFQYLANIAPMVGVAAAVWTLPQRWARTVAVAAVALLAGMTWRQSGEYRDPITLYRATLARNDASWMAHHNLARLLANHPEARAEAIAHYQRAIALKPDHARAYYGVGVLWQRDGRTAEAITALERARALEPRNAQLVANASFLLGELYESRGDARTAAIAAYALADSLKPGVPQTQQALARVRRTP